jgi:hypothetical protein
MPSSFGSELRKKMVRKSRNRAEDWFMRKLALKLIGTTDPGLATTPPELLQLNEECKRQNP